MPSPYSDNLYSDPDPAGSNPAANRDDDASAASALSPSDGYFRNDDDSAVSPTSQQPSHASRRSGSTPYVPNVLVADPTLAKDPDSKAQIAQHLINSDAAPGAASTSSPHPHHNPESYYYPSASPSVSGASIATPSTVTSYPYAQSNRHHSSVQDGPSQQQHRQLHVNTAPQHHPSNYNPSAYQGRGDAPPAYTPSSPDNDPNRHSYSTFPSSTPPRMGVPEEHDRLLSPHQQQAFSDPPKQPLWQRIRESHDSGSLRKKVKKILGILVFVSIILVFMGFNMSGPAYRKRIIDKSPIRIPDMDESELVWHPGRSCRDSPHTYPKETFHASPSSDRVLFIEQTIRKRGWTEPNGPMPSVNGEVILRPTKSGKAELDVEIIANYKDLDIDVEFSTNGGTDHLKVTTPRVVPDASSRDVCIQIRITAWIPEKALVNALSVSTVSLNVFVQEGLALGAENEVNFSTVAGNLIFPADDSDVEPYKLEAPSYKYSTVSGDVKGWLPMYHNLRANTVSGNIFGQITHKDIVLKESESSLLDISSVSGELKINDGSQDVGAAGAKIPARDYLVKLSTTSGDITANVFIGSSSAFASTSGNFKLELVPVLDDRWLHTSWRPLLKTESTSGDHRVQISEPQFITIPDKMNPHKRPTLPETDKDKQNKEAPNQDGPEMKRRRVTTNKRGLTAFESRHSSISGSLHLHYPGSWEGMFSADAMSSDITVRGKDVVVDKKKGGFVGKTVAGHKGDGTSSLKINELSGNVVLTIGQE
ncbi:hypothetical protein ISF_04645 [Cordyceps fumosorosea ARSEF 2679]|uniref:Adhesin domain-containing protein n=1 Tax=Cordyceps fumosorosea (strain ARSEF 2679) TaxID=1081104 RepID=A0A167WLG0_CORFA|nr:hypothetical protein ISF_04645 [Cordyceps fumosorosea ARSEF 2679]OAA63936.1 hypothetical protein ISF_04645 [Cordyceps fumosorosea ARSEF 2679]